MISVSQQHMAIKVLIATAALSVSLALLPASPISAASPCYRAEPTISTPTYVDNYGRSVYMGTAGDDIIHTSGSDTVDIVYGLAGNDVICTFGGDDWVNAGAGDDTIFIATASNKAAGTLSRALNKVIGGKV